jgi:hypothetical protein
LIFRVINSIFRSQSVKRCAHATVVFKAK